MSIHTYACFCRLVDTDGLIIHFNYIAFNKFPSVLTFPYASNLLIIVTVSMSWLGKWVRKQCCTNVRRLAFNGIYLSGKLCMGMNKEK